MHYGRIRRNGHLEPIRKRRHYHTGGYVEIGLEKDHPLIAARARKGYFEYEHRVVFFNTNGFGPFLCHWCSRQVTWETMHVDHLNDIKTDNDIGNLVPSCPLCNLARGREKLLARCGVWLERGGVGDTQSGWARRLGISLGTVRYRVKHWGIERALSL
jgi:hypothetical protein